MLAPRRVRMHDRTVNTIDSPFDFHTTADDVIRGIDLTGTTAIVTGGASGIGIETARSLASAGASVTLAVRNTTAGEQVAEQLRTSMANPFIDVRPLDLADRASVVAFADDWSGPLNLLINNAGIMALPELTRTPEGWELQFATNHLGHFLLTTRLHDALADAGDARVVALSSSGHLYSPVIFDDLHFRFRPYEPILAYGQSKSATSLFAVALTERWRNDNITANAVMPGAIATNLQRHTGGLRTPEDRRKTPQQGASTTIFAAVSPLLDGIGGRYLEDTGEATVVDARTPDNTGVAPYALDPGNADRLWNLSESLVS